MDVIALCEAGFKSTVAPLGTAVTEDQLRLMWRASDEPVIALDGDAAGIKAALRVIDLALPLLQAGQGLRCAVLPGGMDPDDLIRAEGAPAMKAVLDGAQPMVNLLWRRETEGKSFDSPERKAALDKTLRAALARITDPSIRSHYGEDIKRLRWELFGQSANPIRGPRSGQKSYRDHQNLGPVASNRSSILAASVANRSQAKVLASVLLATLVTHPALIRRFESELELLQLHDPETTKLLDAILKDSGPPQELQTRLQAALPAVVENLFSELHVKTAPPILKVNDYELAVHCVAEGLAKLTAHPSVQREIEDGIEDMTGLVDEGLTWRLGQAAQARNDADRTKLDDRGLDEDRPAMLLNLDAILAGADKSKKPR